MELIDMNYLKSLSHKDENGVHELMKLFLHLKGLIFYFDDFCIETQSRSIIELKKTAQERWDKRGHLRFESNETKLAYVKHIVAGIIKNQEFEVAFSLDDDGMDPYCQIDIRCPKGIYGWQLDRIRENYWDILQVRGSRYYGTVVKIEIF